MCKIFCLFCNSHILLFLSYLFSKILNFNNHRCHISCFVPSICNGQFQCLFSCYWVQNCTIISLSCSINRNNIAWDSLVDFLQYAQFSLLSNYAIIYYPFVTYYSKNYAGILGSGVLVTTRHCNSYKCIEVAKYTTATKVKPMRKKGHQHAINKIFRQVYVKFFVG